MCGIVCGFVQIYTMTMNGLCLKCHKEIEDASLRTGRIQTNHAVCGGCGVPVIRNIRKPCTGQFRCRDCKLRMARENSARASSLKKARKLATKVLD